MLLLSVLGSALATPVSPSAAFDRFLDATTSARHAPMCLTPLVEDLAAHRAELSPVERAEVDAFLGPAAEADSLPLRTRGLRLLGAPPPPSTGTGRTTCVEIAEKYGANQLVGEHFTIAWDDGASESQAEDLMEAFEKSYDRQVDELGWAEPTGMDAFNLWVYIAKDNSYAGAYTSAASCPSRGYMPYIVVYSGTFSAGNWYQDCAAHEFNHASQQAYGLYDTYDLWWWEATATWVEEYVYSHNGWSQHTYGFARWPEIGMHASSQSNQEVFWHMYGMSVWAFYLDEYLGGPDFVKSTWDYLESHSPGIATMPDVLPDLGYDFDETYAGFLSASAVMDFDDHDWFYPVTFTKEMTELPHTGTPSGSLPEGLGLNYFRIDRDANPDGKDLGVTFSSQEDVDWYVVLSTTSDSSTVSAHTVATKDEETGAWVARIPWDGEHDAYLTVSPKIESTSRDYEYTYTVALVEPPVVDTGDTGIGDETETDPPLESEESGGSGSCAATAPASGLASLATAALAAIALRSRRREVTSAA
jgi:hypothetical protein